MTSHATPCRRRKPPTTRCRSSTPSSFWPQHRPAKASSPKPVVSMRTRNKAARNRHRWRRPHTETLRQEAVAL